MKKSVFSSLLATIFVVGCVGQPILSTYDRDEIAWSLKKGTSKVEGSGFLSRNDGMLVKCSGKEVSLVAAGKYATERITKLYGSDLGGYNKSRRVVAAMPGYTEDIKTTVCDVDGKFEFADVPAGKYYVATSVLWYIGNSWQGGHLAKFIEVKDGETKKIVLTYP